MTYKEFKEIIDLMIKHSNMISKAYSLKIDLIDAFDEQSSALHLLWGKVLTEFGYDWLSWYLYEKNGISGKPRKDLQAWDENKNEICKDLKGLWEYLTKEKYFRI